MPFPFEPLRLKAWPTSPEAKVTLPSRVPALPLIASRVSPLPSHHATRLEGAGSQEGGTRTSCALELTAEPTELVTMTKYCPALVTWASGTSRTGLVAP